MSRRFVIHTNITILHFTHRKRTSNECEISKEYLRFIMTTFLHPNIHMTRNSHSYRTTEQLAMDNTNNFKLFEENESSYVRNGNTFFPFQNILVTYFRKRDDTLVGICHFHQLFSNKNVVQFFHFY